MSTEKKKTEAAPVYKSGYTDALKNNLAKVMENKNFSYDANKDKLFSQYKNSYEKSGRTAMQDTMGNAAILTGGYGNSYAATAGQQAYNNYMSKLSDKIPELEQRAYERYRDDEESAYKRLNTLIGLEKSDYDRYRDSVGDYNTNREFEYNKSKDELAQRNLQARFERDNYENDRDYSRKVYENDRDYAQSVTDSDRNYQIRLNNSLRDAVKKEEEEQDDTKFSPKDAYDFLSKYGNMIYTDEEYIEALYQLYGDKDGFFGWIDQMTVPGDINDTSYLELLYKIHPELKPTAAKKMNVSEDDLIRRTATNGGATPPHSQSFWWVNQGQRGK